MQYTLFHPKNIHVIYCLTFLKIALSITCTFFFNDLYAQESITNAFKDKIKKANAFYNDHYYEEALKIYISSHKLEPRDDIKIKIADCLVKLNEPEEACIWFGKLIENSYPLNNKDILNYVLALTGNADYKNAQIWYEKYLTKKDEEINNNLDFTKKDIALLYSDSILFDVRPIEINTDQSEFSPFFYEKGIAFISSRKNPFLVKNNLPQSKNGFLDLYYAPFLDLPKKTNPLPTVGKAKSIANDFPSLLHKGPASLYNNGKNMLITLNSPENAKSETNSRKLFIYESKKKGKKWIKPIPLPFNSSQFSCGHPTISKHGKILYFISDMPGGFGGTDLYKCVFKKNKWSEPINLGKTINTEGNEMFPFLHNDTTLYFSSNGHTGLGGLDILKVSLSDSMEIIKNVGYPINTNSDDFGITLNENGSIGFFSSNRRNKGTDDDIFKVLINVGKPGPLYEKNISGTITLFESQYRQNNPDLVADADIRVIDYDSLDPVAEGKTDENGNFNLDIPYAGNFFLICNKKGAGTYQTIFNIPSKTTYKEDFFIVFFSEDLFETE